mmetsp:Transcript_44818/g.105098  ORF Transcript_44818/g.105098 Transcript_44818/m.105098 type:complete len:528 (-) Transcript_44818:63-1646(-)
MSSTRKGSDAFLLKASHKDDQRRGGGAGGSVAASVSKLFTGQEDQSTGTIILAIIVVIIAFLLFFMLGGPSEPSSASQEIADLEAKYRLLLSSHKEVLKELDGLQKKTSQPDPNEKEIKVLHKELLALADKYKKVEAGSQKFADTTGGLKKEVQGVKTALAQEVKEREAAAKLAATAEQQIESLRKEALRVEAQLNATVDDAATQRRVEAVRAEAVKQAVHEAIKSLEEQRAAVVSEAASVQSEALGSLKGAVREELLAEVRVVLEKMVNDKVQKEVAANKPTLSFSPFASRPAAEQLEQTVKAVLSKIYEERLGKVDWLLEINGASVEYNSPSFDPCTNFGVVDQVRCRLAKLQFKQVQLKPSTFLRVDWSWWSDHSGGVQGNCWAMNGNTGWLTVKLGRAVIPETFVMQHLPPSISLDQGWTAPFRFRIVGWFAGALKDSTKGAGADGEGEAAELMTQRVLVEGEYQISELAVGADELMKQIQYFPVKQQDQSPINRVRLEILSNHGKEEYTCLYHMRLYGTPAM